MDETQMMEHLAGPNAPDEMTFVLRRDDPDPNRTFSQEGFDKLANQYEKFLMARAYAHWKRTGKMPKHLRATVKLDWIAPENEWLDESPRPWFSLIDVSPDPMTPDGAMRFGSGANDE